MERYENLKQERYSKIGSCWFVPERWSSEGGYEHLELHVMLQEAWQARTAFTLTFQASKEFQGWYGFTIEVKTDNLETLLENVKLAKKLLGGEEGGDLSLKQVLSALEFHHCEQRVYDNRFRSYLREKDIPDAGVSRWVEDYRRLGHNGCHASCYATNAQEAQEQIRQELAKHKELLIEFLNADEPVMPVGYEHAPEWQDVRETVQLAWALEAVA